MANVLAVVPTSVIKTGSFSYVFIAQAGVDYRSQSYGFFFFDKGQWEILAAKDGEIAVSEKGDKNTLIKRLSRDLPDLILLVEPGDFEQIKSMFESAGHKVTKHAYDGPLKTHGRA